MTEATSGSGRTGAQRRWVTRPLRWGTIFLSTLLLGTGLASAYAEDRAREGLSLLEQLGPSLVGDPQGFELNGERIWFASELSARQVPEVLDTVERDCAMRGGNPFSELGQLPRTLRALLPAPGKFLSARADGTSGQFACFTNGGERAPGLVERSRKFLNSGDLAALGNARYVVAERDDSAGSTHVTAIWTEGSFNLRALFPTRGDSPGSDSSVVSRPEGSVRLLYARRISSGDAVRLYKTSEPAASVLDRFSRELVQKGFSTAELPATRASRELAQTSRAFFKGGASVIVSARSSFVSGTIVAVVEIETTGRAVVRQEAP